MSSEPVSQSLSVCYLISSEDSQPIRKIQILENVAVANALQLEAARDTPALSLFNYDSHAKFEVAEPIHCRILLLIHYAVNLTFDPLILTFDIWPWTLAAYRLWRDETLYQIWTQSNNPRRSYSDFSVLPDYLEHSVTCSFRLLDNFHQVWPSTTYPCLNYSMFWCWYVRSRCDYDLWPVDL